MTPPGQAPNPPWLSAVHQQLADPPAENGGLGGQQGLADVRPHAGLVMPAGAGGHGADAESAGAGAAAAASATERSAAVAIVTPGGVRNRQFSSTRLRPGYDEQEVDAFLDEVEAELGRLRRDNRELELKLAGTRGDARGADAALSAHGTRAGGEAAADSSPGTGILALAQHVADQAIAAARRDAAETIADARRRADQIVQTATRNAGHAVSDATAQADRLERGARERHRQAVASLGPLREELTARVDYLRAFEREYRANLKAHLEGHLREIQAGADDSGDIPAASAAGSRPPVGAGMDHAEPRDTGQPAPPAASFSGPPISPSLPEQPCDDRMTRPRAAEQPEPHTARVAN